MSRVGGAPRELPMSAAERTSYDDVPYASFPFPQTHPDRLATVATLLGLAPPPPDRGRVLELGCAAGGNLIPMAVALPDASFVGIDLSARQIDDGLQTVRALGLDNVELKHLSILDVDDDAGRFDYVICHGVFSWVPREVQDKVLSVCARNLSADGVAYVSYNTYPGWRLRGMIRDMMVYHAGRFDGPAARVAQARGLLDFLAGAVAGQNTSYSSLLQSEVELLRRQSDAYLFHEHLEKDNEPLYFHQFAERAAARGLRYLGEADLTVMVPANFPPGVEQVLQQLSPDLIHIEQYMDFLRNRTFRQTLLCHADREPVYRIHPDRVAGLHVASPAQPVSAADLRPGVVEQFRGTDGVTLSARDPVVKAAMRYLAEAWPRAVPFGQLLEEARGRLGDAAGAEDARLLGESLLSFYAQASTRLVELHACPPRFAAEVSERPAASPLARLQAEKGNQVTNLRHELMTLQEFDRQLLRLLDGQRDRPALVEAMTGLAEEGVLVVQDGGRLVRDAGRLRELMGRAADQQLPALARAALLVR